MGAQQIPSVLMEDRPSFHIYVVMIILFRASQVSYAKANTEGGVLPANVFGYYMAITLYYFRK